MRIPESGLLAFYVEADQQNIMAVVVHFESSDQSRAELGS